MKFKLSCCEINKKSEFFPNKSLECDHCECVFENKEQLDDHNREIHEVLVTGKRKLKCCEPLPLLSMYVPEKTPTTKSF